MHISLACLPVAVVLACGVAHAQAGPDICKGVEEVLKVAPAKGLASLASGWKTGQIYASIAKPKGMDRAGECQVVRGSGVGARDQFDCLWSYMAAPDAVMSSLTQLTKACLEPKGWRADATEQDRGAAITRFTLKGSQVEVLAVEVKNSAMARSDRLSVTAPVK